LEETATKATAATSTILMVMTESLLAPHPTERKTTRTLQDVAEVTTTSHVPIGNVNSLNKSERERVVETPLNPAMGLWVADKRQSSSNSAL
jgi:hypothetical protein